MPLLCISEFNFYFYALQFDPSLLSKDGLNILCKACKNPNQLFIKNNRSPVNFCTMRKASFLSVFVFLAAVCSAQEARWGVFGGPQISSARYTVDGVKQQTSSKCGFQLGTNWKVPFENKLYFSPAIFYSLKGYK